MPLMALAAMHGLRLCAGGAVPGGRPWHLARAIYLEEVAYFRAAWFMLGRWPSSGDPSASAERPPAVLVHGLMGSPGLLSPLARALSSAGTPEVLPARYPSLRGGWDAALDGVAAAVEDAADRWGGPVDLVGHSLGGLAARWYVKRGGGAPRVRRLISLAGPQQGTAMHRLVPPKLGRVFDPEGDLIRALGEGPEPIPTWSIWCPYDHQVVPAPRAKIPGAVSHRVPGAGHNGLLFDRRVHALVVELLG